MTVTKILNDWEMVMLAVSILLEDLQKQWKYVALKEYATLD